MKKYFKLLAKKSLSLFMAVIMLMTCWVWVAPTEAEAANSPHEGYYYVQIIGNLTDWEDDANVAKNNWVVDYDGGSVTFTGTSVYNGGSNKDNYLLASGWVPGFPTGVKNVYQKGCGGDKWRIEKPTVYAGNGSDISEKIGGRTDGYNANQTSETTVTMNMDSEINPYAESVKSSAGLEKKTISVPSLGVTTPGSVAFTKGGVYDQYGVRIKDLESYNLYSDDAASAAAYTPENGVWVSGTTVYASADAQKGIPNSSGSQKVYLFGEGSGLKGYLAEITLNYPQYTVTVAQNGSVTGLVATMDMSDDSTRTTAWTGNGYYGATLETYPKGTATANGYNFKGFWTAEQPTTGDANYNAAGADFANPTDTTTFNAYKAQDGAVLSENNMVVTLADGSKYYNAGTQWDTATHREILGNNTFYGWWISQDITVKFYDIDGKYLGTQTAKYGNTPAKNWYPNPKNGYNAGAFEYQTFAEQWRDITGAVITEGDYTFGPLATLSLTPIYTKKTYSDKYDIIFVDPVNNGSNISKEYDYRYSLAGEEIPTFGVPVAILYDSGYTYEFSGWTTQKPASGYYHTVAKDDTSIVENTDWVVRADTTYYAIYRSTVKEYVIAFNYTDTTGTAKTEIKYIPYGSAISTPSDVNRTYATGGYGYTLEGWDYVNNESATVMLGVDASLVFNDDNVFLTAENLKGATPEKPIVFKANYDEGQPTPYTVTFKYKDAKGNDKTVSDQVYHGYNITAETVEKLSVPAQYDDGTALYTFSGLWKVTEGTADKAEYKAEEFTSFGPTSHVTFEAVYGEGVPFYTVTYIDGANTYSERVLAGSNLPAWTVEVDGETTEYIPVKAKTETGEYTFKGWFDAEQADKDFAETNGTEYTTASTVDGDLVLYSQFTFSAFKFDIVFKNYDGTVLAEGKYEAGEEFKAIYDEAEEAATRPTDKTYSYSFIGWDYKVPDSFLCEGKDMTYTAQYRPSYIYYKARWYNDIGAMNGADHEMEFVGQDGLLAITSHTYEGAVYAPSVDLTAPEGYVFDGWYYKNGDEEAAYKRGMIITNAMSFYAKYKEAVKVYTVTTVVGDKTTEYEIAENDTATVIGRPLDGFVNAEKHNKFEGWFTADDEAFDLDTEINANITIYAKFTETAHTKNQKELVSAPTYYAKGSEKVWCSCSKEDTIETVEIPVLTDTKAPTGTIYLGTQGSWSSTDAVGAAATDNDPVTLYANADTDIILTINDTGDVNTAYNPGGVGKGIANIQGIISTGVFGADTTEIAGIKTIFTDDSETLNNTANYVIRLGDYEGLISGTTYIAYYYAKDKADNVLNKNVRTAKFIYDNEAPVITIEGDTNTEKPANILTYCGQATVKDIEEGATVTVNGAEVSVTESKYEIKEAGNYIITVTDKAGNTATKKIIITDGHDEVTTTKAVTCTEDGYTKVICAVCGKIIKNETIESEGHKYSAEVTVAPTCTEDGYTIKTCSVCGDEVKTNETAALNHTDTGRYTKVTKAATCSVKGEKTTYCQACDVALDTEEIPLDKENGHSFGTQKLVLKPTCTADGKYYYRCSYCYETSDAKDEDGNVLVIEKLNHENTGRYTAVTKTATCYEEGELTTYCKVCDVVMDTSVIAKTSHILKLVTYDEEADKSEEYPNGYTQLECQANGCTHKEGKKAIVVEGEDETFTVVFKGMGENGADLELEFDPGETVTEAAVYGEADENGKYDIPEKEATATEKFTFAGWKGTDGIVIKLPFNVTKSETYTAEFTATKRIYTHTFKINANDEDAFATIIGTYNSTDKKPAGVPTKDATATATYKFAGWKDTAGNKVTDFTMTDDATFVADFTAEAIKFNVVYLNEGKHFYSETVDGGMSHTVIDGVPAKDYDDDYHYTFAGWTYGEETYKADDVITGIASNYRLVAKYTAVEHDFTVVNDATKTWDATCEKEGQKTEVCACGCEKVTVLPKSTDHNYEVQPDGSKICSVCGDTIAAEAKEVTIKFMDGEKVLKEVKVEEGKTYTYTAPEKAATAQYEYKFEKWTSEGADDVTTAEITVTAGATDAVYTAVYTATARVYNVTYADADNKVITTSKVEYGKTIPAFDTDKYDVPEKAYTANEHFTFEKWDHAADTVVTGDTVIRPVYKAEEHNWYDLGDGEATCTEPGGKKQACACGITSTAGGGTPALGHSYKIVDEKKADYGVEGYVKKVCERCGDEIVTTTPARDYKTIKVVVKNANGALVEGAKVSLYKDRNFYETQWSNKDGVVEFKNLVHEAEYTVQISYDGIVVDQEVGNGAQDEVKIEEPVQQCSCSCHRPGFWGILFRFFHKIISWFTGKVNCCADPQTI